MGCFSSKMVCRTASFRGCAYIHSERMGSHPLEDLLSSKTGGDPLLTLLYTGNAVVMKLKSQQEKEKVSFSLDRRNCTENKLAECEDPDDVVNAWELMAGLDENERDDDGGSGDNHEQQELQEKHLERKQSAYGLRITCERFSDDRRLVQIEEIHVDDFLSCSSDDGKDDHELDVLKELVVERRSGQSQSQGHHHEGSEALESSACADLDAVNVSGLDRDCDSMQFTVSGGQFQCPRRTPNPTSIGKSYTASATGEELRALRIPSFQFRSAGDARRRTSTEGAGEEESMSGYATPKFGCYVELDPVSGNLQDELIARLEEAMKQLAVDEERVLMTVVEEFLEQVQGDG